MLFDKISDFPDPRLLAGLPDLISHAVHHKRRMIIQTLNNLQELCIADEIILAVQHLLQIVIVLLIPAHLNMNQDAKLVRCPKTSL